VTFESQGGVILSLKTRIGRDEFTAQRRRE